MPLYVLHENVDCIMQTLNSIYAHRQSLLTCGLWLEPETRHLMR